MKLTQQIAVLTLIGAAFQAEARKVGVDFAPVTTWDGVTNKEVPLSDNGKAVGWYLKDVPGIDYTKLQTDEAYAQTVANMPDPNSKIGETVLDTRVHNLVYDLATGNSLSDIPRAKNSDGTEDDYTVCFDAASLGSNHRSCSVLSDPVSGFTIVQVDLKWTTGSINAIKFNGVQAVAWGDLNAQATDVFSAALANKYKNDAEYKKDKDSLAFTFQATKISPFNATTALVKGSGDAEVPKGDENTFGATLTGTLKLIQQDDKVVLQKIAPAAAPATPTSK